MYDLELDKVVNKIEQTKAKTVIIQLADGLKPKATMIHDYLKNNSKAEILIHLNSCFGACDTPNIKADLLVQFGHNEFL
jgi:diphthamide biosynthesis enzyme Dph1/Dph2-like protein|tara:strand:- start:48 stop:284 length:237 start_codon:yes stop_codon:yes gene_type:complete